MIIIILLAMVGFVIGYGITDTIQGAIFMAGWGALTGVILYIALNKKGK